MSILDRLYKSNPKDIASGGAQVIRRFGFQLSFGPLGAAQVQAAEPAANALAPDLCRLIQYASVLMLPGAAQTQTMAEFALIDAGGVAFLDIYIPVVNQGVGQVAGGTVYPNFLQLAGERVNITGYFNGAANPNQGTVQWGGIEFQRGSIQR